LHAQGLVHWDAKPSNILFINGQPKLADAGLVASVDDARSLVGTPGFIPPEGPGTPEADIYSLGKVLYEAAFGKDRHEFPQLPANVGTRSDHASLLELNEITF
jgi:eukaryotic-like serine/threonine-protein kinase